MLEVYLGIQAVLWSSLERDIMRVIVSMAMSMVIPAVLVVIVRAAHRFFSRCW